MIVGDSQFQFRSVSATLHLTMLYSPQNQGETKTWVTATVLEAGKTDESTYTRRG
jgi:hypothetical protein